MRYFAYANHCHQKGMMHCPGYKFYKIQAVSVYRNNTAYRSRFTFSFFLLCFSTYQIYFLRKIFNYEDFPSSYVAVFFKLQYQSFAVPSTDLHSLASYKLLNNFPNYWWLLIVQFFHATYWHLEWGHHLSIRKCTLPL